MTRNEKKHGTQGKPREEAPEGLRGLGKPWLREIVLRDDRIPDRTAYPFGLPAVRHLGRLPFHPDVTFLVGENGAGKSTLLEAVALAWGFNAEGGTKNFRFATRPSHSELHGALALVRSPRRPRDGFFLRAESFYNVATEIERLDAGLPAGDAILGAYGGVPLHDQSHGEAFLSLMMHRFRGQGLYLLDEPEAALSPSRQMAVLGRMHDLVAEGSQFIVATHSPILMAYPGAWIYLLDQSGISRVRYEETEHYAVTRTFLNNPRGMLAEILGPREDPEGDRDA